MQHPFESLEYKDYSWTTTFYSELLESSVELIIESENNNIEKWKLELFDNFIKNTSELKSSLYSNIFTYYQKVAPDYRERAGVNYHNTVPDINSVNDVKKLINPTGIIISDLEPSDKEICLLFECLWEVEHGLAVKLSNEIIVEVGSQNICI